MNQFVLKNSIFILLLTSLAWPAWTAPIPNPDVLNEAYQDYYKTSQDYIDTMNDAISSIRDWRKKKLAETFDSKLSVIEQTLTLSNQNLIEEFHKFLKANGSEALDDVLLIRLAQLHFEKANLKFNQAMRSFQQNSDPNQDIPVPNYDKTIQFAKKFIEYFPHSPIGDKAYYLLGYCNEEMGKSKNSVEYYKELLSHYPVSEYADETSWRLGEIYYSLGSYKNAEPYYERLIKTKGPFFTKSLYKLGATEFVEKDYEQSSKTFQRILQEIDAQNLTDLEDLSLYDESLDYLATLLTQNTSLKMPETLMPELYYRMGLLYKKRLDEKSMREVYIQSAKKYSSSRFMPLYYSELINSFESIQDTEKANYYRSLFVQELTNNQKWWLANDQYKNVIFQTQDMLEFALLKSAEYYADKGYTKTDYDLLKIAKNRYFNFITKYSWSPYRDSAKLELADLEYYLGNYVAASNDYYEIANQSDSPVLQEEAAYSLIWSEVKKVNYSLNFDAKALDLLSVQKSELNSQEKAFTQAALFYISKIKTSFRKNKILYKLAEVYSEHGDFENAISYLNTIVSDTENPSAVNISAFKFLSEIYNFKTDYASYESINELYHTTLFTADIDVLDKDSVLQKYRDKLEKGLNLELQEQYLDAAQELEKVVVQNPGHAMNNFVQLKIANLYLKANQFEQAKSAISKLEAGPYKKEAIFLKAKMFYQLAQFDKSEDLFEKFAQNKKHPWYSQALLNAVTLARQLKQPEKLIELTKKITPNANFAFIYTDTLQTFLELKKYDDLYKLVGTLKKTKLFDNYLLQSYVLKAQLNRDDYVGLDRSCTTLNGMSAQNTEKSARLIYDLSLCEFYKLRSIVGQSQTTLDDLVGELNKIYAFKVETVTLQALNEIITKSPLKDTYKLQFSQLMQKGWSIAQKHPLHPESLKLSQNIYKETGKIPLSLSYFQNWNISLADQLDFKSFTDKSGQWPDIRQECETRQYNTCLEKLENLYNQNPNDDILENILIASLKAQDDVVFDQFLKKYLQNQNEKARVWAVMAYRQNPLAGEKELTAQPGDSFSLLAKNVNDFNQGLRSQAQNNIAQMIEDNPKYPLTYLYLARMYMEKGFPELALNVLQNGFQNSAQRSLLPALYQTSALVYSNTSYAEGDERDQSPAIQFAIAFSALKNKDNKRVSMALDMTKKYTNWFDMIKSMQLSYLKPKEFKNDLKTSSNYVLWIQQIQKFSQNAQKISSEVIKNFAMEKGYLPNYKWIEQSISERDIATEKK